MNFESYYDGPYPDSGKTLAEREEADRIAQEENEKLTGWQDPKIISDLLRKSNNN